MKSIVLILAALGMSVGLGACKTPSKEGSSLSSLSIGNAKACERTKDRIKEAYEKKELRSLAEKGHRYLIQEIAKGNKAAMITEAGLRIATFQKGGQVYGELVQKIFDGTASESEVTKFTQEYERAGGLKSAVDVLKTAQRAVIAQYMAEIQASVQGRAGADVQARAEAKEIVREITDWSNEMSSRLAAQEKQSAPGQPGLKQEASAVRAVVDTVLTEFIKGNQKLASANIAGLAEAEVAQLELAKANADLAEGVQKQNAERQVAEVFKKYGNTTNAEIQRAVSIQTLHMLHTAPISSGQKASIQGNVRRMLGGNNARFQVAEIASLEGLIEIAEQAGQKSRAAELTRQLQGSFDRLKQEMGIRGAYNMAEGSQRRSAIDQVIQETQSRRNFEAKSEMSYYRSYYRGIRNSAARGRKRG